MNISRILQILEAKERNLADYRFVNCRPDVSSEFRRTHTYHRNFGNFNSHIQRSHISYFYHFLRFIPHVTLFLASRFYSSLCHNPCTCASVEKGGQGEHVALSNNRTFLCNHREKNRIPFRSTMSRVYMLFLEMRLFFCSYIYVKEIVSKRVFTPSHIA